MASNTDTRDFAEIRFDVLLMNHIQACGDQLKRLPHEQPQQDFTNYTGTTKEDIVESYCNLVEHLSELLAPYRDNEFNPETERPTKCAAIFLYSKKKFGECIKLCNRKGLLLEKYKPTTNAEAEETAEPEMTA